MSQDYDPKSTVASLAAMLGWANVPPREVLERSLREERRKYTKEIDDLKAERERDWAALKRATDRIEYLEQKVERYEGLLFRSEDRNVKLEEENAHLQNQSKALAKSLQACELMLTFITRAQGDGLQFRIQQAREEELPNATRTLAEFRKALDTPPQTL